MRQIDWNVTARTGTPHVRIHLAERALVTWLVLDTSPSMTFGTAERRKADVAEGAALAIGYAATRRGNRLGLVTFGDEQPAAHFRRGRDARACSACCSPCATRSAARRAARRRGDLDRRGAPARRATSRASARTSSSSPTSAARATGAGRCSCSAAATTSWRSRSATRASRSCRSSASCSSSIPRPAGSCASTPRASGCATQFAAAAASERREVAAELASAGARHVVLLDPRRLAARADRLPPPRGSAMSFASPLALLALLLVPAAAVGYVWFQRRRVARGRRASSSPRCCPNVVDRVPGWRRHLPVAILLLAVTGFLVGFARPHATISVRSEEATAILAIDTSRSMGATDVAPTRLAAAQASARRFLADLPGEVPRRRSSPSARWRRSSPPPTQDREFVDAALDALRVGEATALGDALATAVDVATRDAARASKPPRPARSRRPPSILVLSDGARRRRARRAADEAIRRARDGEDPRLHGAARHRGRRRRRCRTSAATSSGSRCRPTPTRCASVATQTGGSFFAAPTEDDLERRLRRPEVAPRHDAQGRGDHVRLRRPAGRPAPARRRRSPPSGSGGSRDPGRR